MVDEVSTLNTQLSRAKNLLKMEKIEKNRLVGENAKLRKARKKNTNEYHD